MTFATSGRPTPRRGGTSGEGAARIPTLVVVLVIGATLARGAAGADRDLGSCPDLAPLRPTAPASRAAARCARALARAGVRYLAGALAAHDACLARWQAGPADDDEDAATRCLGRVVLASGERIRPTEEQTARRLAALEAALRRKVTARCGETPPVVPYGCERFGADVAGCVLADHAEHVLHLVDGTHAELTPLASRTAVRRQRTLARASRAAVLGLVRAENRCLARHARRADATARCLGGVRSGIPVPPTDRRTARRIARIERRLRRRAARVSNTALAARLACLDRREALLLVQATHAATPEAPTTQFIDWGALRNPVLALDDQALKDQSVAFDDGWFYVFSSVRFRPDDATAATTPRWFFRTRDFLAWESFVGNPALNGPGLGPGSPDVTRIGGLWRMTFQGRPAASTDPADREIFLATSADLASWSAPARLTDDLVPNAPIIDGALAFDGARWILGFKDRVRQTFQVARSAGPDLDGAFDPPARAIAGSDDPREGFAENYQFVAVDGVWRLVATARDPDPYRCENVGYSIYTCDHEPFVYTLGGPPSALASWTRWVRKRRLRIPFEAWNGVMHANTGHLADWRAYDGFFYLSYAGSADGDQFELRGHGKIGLARSRDLVHWRLPGDLRD